jgi:hypothetical protein
MARAASCIPLGPMFLGRRPLDLGAFLGCLLSFLLFDLVQPHALPGSQTALDRRLAPAPGFDIGFLDPRSSRRPIAKVALAIVIHPCIDIAGGCRHAEEKTQDYANPLFHVHLLCAFIPASIVRKL